jgi:hypothetical protein
MVPFPFTSAAKLPISPLWYSPTTPFAVLFKSRDFNALQLNSSAAVHPISHEIRIANTWL